MEDEDESEQEEEESEEDESEEEQSEEEELVDLAFSWFWSLLISCKRRSWKLFSLFFFSFI